jgi:hypothetical protein
MGSERMQTARQICLSLQSQPNLRRDSAHAARGTHLTRTTYLISSSTSRPRRHIRPSTVLPSACLCPGFLSLPVLASSFPPVPLSGVTLRVSSRLHSSGTGGLTSTYLHPIKTSASLFEQYNCNRTKDTDRDHENT